VDLALTQNVPSTFAAGADTVAVLVLLAEFMMLRTALLRAQVRLYAAQSFVVSALAAIVAAGRDVPELYVLAVVSFLLKVILVPAVILRMLRGSKAEIAGSGALGVSSAVIVSIVVAAFGFFAVGALHVDSRALPSAVISLAVAVVLIAFVLMIVRRDVISQAVGFFSLENGISVASLVVGAGMPLVLEVVLLFDLLVAAVAFGLIMRGHHRRTSSLSTASLDRLRG
jgi:hydrogenase-4 component E